MTRRWRSATALVLRLHVHAPPAARDHKHQRDHTAPQLECQEFCQAAATRVNQGQLLFPQPQAHAMNYQLVIKFWRKSLADESFLATIESQLKEVLGAAAELDGYDVSAKEINLFVLTKNQRHEFRKAKSDLEPLGIVQGVSAAFRLVGGAQFTSIWPLRALRKFTLP